jgi:4-hydroxythreonine-4-phosphate dehydrogenase
MSHHPEKDHRPRIGITLGDPNGIGPEVIIKTFLDNRMLQVCTPVIYGSSKAISFYRKSLNIQEFNYNSLKSIDALIPRKLNVLNCWEEDIKIDPGLGNEISGKYALKALEAAVNDLAARKIDALVTGPVNKEIIGKAGFSFPGHTEYLAQKFNAPEHLMFMVSENLKIAVVSGHVPLKNAASALSVDKILKKLRVMNSSLLKDFGIRKPRIAVLGINPHAGDNGLLGSEENEIIIPSVKQAFAENILAFGPYSADGFFGSAVFRQFDGVLAMYHDQGLVPFKALAFEDGVNFTAGLPVVRTSPDHGTAYDIAGKNLASESSMRHAIYAACDIIQKRQEYQEIAANPLPMGFSKLSRDQ